MPDFNVNGRGLFRFLGGLLLTLLLLATASAAFSQTVDLIRGGGSAGEDAGNATATDASGNVYVTGYFSGNANFNTPSASGSNELASVGNKDGFLARFANCASSFTVLGSGTATCASSPTITLNGSQTGVSYQLLRDGTTAVSSLTGTGVALSFGPQSLSGVYTVVATLGTSCSVTGVY